MKEAERMLGRRISFVLAVALIVSLIAVACAPAAAPSPTQAPAATKAASKEESSAPKPAAGQDSSAAKPAEKPAESKAPATLRKVTLFLPLPTKSIAMFPAIIPQELGYYKDEGLDVSVETSDGSPFIMQQMATSKADAGLVIAGTAMSAWGQDHKSKAVWEMLTQPVFRTLVPEESSIKSFQDLKGKDVGVANITGGDVPGLKAELAKAGLNVGKDVQLQPLGRDMGVVWQALKDGKVAAFDCSYNDSVKFESIGAKFRYISPAVDPDKLQPSTPLLVRSEVFEKEPKVAIGLARAMSKAVVFAKENPDAALAIMKKAYPAEHTDVSFARLYMKRAVEMSWPAAGRPFGQQSMAGAKELQELMINPSAPSGLQKAFDLTPFITNDLIKEINSFDVEKVKKDAKESKLTYP